MERSLLDGVARLLVSGEVTQHELAALGDRSVMVLLGCLVTGRLPGTPTSELDAGQRRTALECLGLLGRARVMPVLAGSLNGEAPAEIRATALRVLAVIGKSEDLDVVLETGGDGQAWTISANRTELVEVAVASILERDAGAQARIESRFSQAPPDVAGALVRASSSVGRAEGLAMFGRLLGGRSDTDSIVLAHMGRAARNVPRPVDSTVRDAVRAFLWKGDRQRVRAAAQALGELEDFESIENLIDLLGNEEASVSGAAHWALERISGLSMSADAGRWSGWYEAQVAWFTDRMPALVEALSSPDDGKVFGALQELAARHYERHTIADHIEEVLEHDSSPIRALACTALGRLGSGNSTEALLERLDDDDEAVARAAWTALGRITGLELPQDPKAWREALNEAGAKQETKIESQEHEPS